MFDFKMRILFKIYIYRWKTICTREKIVERIPLLSLRGVRYVHENFKYNMTTCHFYMFPIILIICVLNLMLRFVNK